ncbi:MAG: hypothetical protein ACXVWU_03700 [Nocardioides sp.]
MRRRPHENVATVLVDPRALEDVELALMALDLRVWPVRTAPVCVDGARMAFQVRRRLLVGRRGAWDEAADWVPVWVGFGPSWRDGDEPLPWSAHAALWEALDSYAAHVRFQRRLGGVPPLDPPASVAG